MDRNRQLLFLLVIGELLMLAATIQAVNSLFGQPDLFDMAAAVVTPIILIRGLVHIRRLWHKRGPY